MSEELDLTKATWVSSKELPLEIITQSIFENYPNADITEELDNCGFTLEDLLADKKLAIFLKSLNEKYPE